MGVYEPSREQVEELEAELKKRFGAGHRLAVVHNEGYGFLIKTSTEGSESSTTINTLEPPVTEAIFRYSRAVAAEEHALETDDMRISATAIESAHPNMPGLMIPSAKCNKALTYHLRTIIRHTSAMTMHEHAADYTRFEHAKYSHLQAKNASHTLRGVALLSRAYIKSAARRHGADISTKAITAGVDMDRTDKRIIMAAMRVLDEVHRQRVEGPNINVAHGTMELDDEFSRLKKAFCYE